MGAKPKEISRLSPVEVEPLCRRQSGSFGTSKPIPVTRIPAACSNSGLPCHPAHLDALMRTEMFCQSLTKRLPLAFASCSSRQWVCAQGGGMLKEIFVCFAISTYRYMHFLPAMKATHPFYLGGGGGARSSSPSAVITTIVKGTNHCQHAGAVLHLL